MEQQSDNFKCHDCNKEITVIGNELQGAKALKYKTGNEEIMILKCNECYEKDPSLRNFQKCEVYSRVVGYLRPVQQWNKGKKEEFKQRKLYKT